MERMDSGDLAGTAWTLLQFETDADVIPALSEAPPTLAFSAPGTPGADASGSATGSATGSASGGEQENRISGSSGCNRFVSSYTLTGNHLKLGSLVATRMLCTPPERMAQEARYLRALQAAERYELRDGQLLITFTGGRLSFEPAVTSRTL